MQLHRMEDVLVLIGGLLFLTALFVWPIVLMGMRHARRLREIEQAERLEAIRCGYVLPRDRSVNPAVGIGVGVPCAAFTLAFLATFSDAALAAWPSAGAASIAAVICATVLALKQPAEKPGKPSVIPNGAGKHAMDPDALDVVGRRG